MRLSPSLTNNMSLTRSAEPPNLLTFSTDFANPVWNKIGGSVTSNAANGPDGNLTADLFTEDSATSGHALSRSMSVTIGQRVRVTAIVAYAGRQWFRIDLYGAGSPATDESWFDIQNGVKGTTQANVISPAPVALANGFYRCTSEIVAAATGTLSFNLSGASANTSTANYLGSGAPAFYIDEAKFQVV